jgi:phosphomevalonate kinase
MHSARNVYETAPLGSLIRYSNGQPRPPERFKKKLRAWEYENGTGRLVGRHLASGRLPASFTLYLGDFKSEGTTIMVAHRIYSREDDAPFEIVETPKPGMVRVLTGHGDREELHFLAPDMESAQRWIGSRGYTGMRVEVVPDPDPVVIPQDVGKAA